MPVLHGVTVPIDLLRIVIRGEQAELIKYV